MKRWINSFLAGCAITVVGLNSCVLETADVPKQRELTVVADQFSEKDSSIIMRYSKLTNTRVTFKVQTAESYLNWIQNHPFQPTADIIWFEHDSIFQVLVQEGKLSIIRKEELFGKLERQFHTGARYFIPICHDPLVVTAPKDSGSYCKTLVFNQWHQKDSLRAQLLLSNSVGRYYAQLNKEPFVFLWSKKRAFSKEQILPLSTMVKSSSSPDSIYRKYTNNCNYYLIARGKYITASTCLGIPKYARNKAGANALIAFLMQQHEYIAFGRNNLSCQRNSDSFKNVKSLDIKK